MGLEEYQRKRDFSNSTEPKGNLEKINSRLYVVQKHDASHLHYDFRLELGGVLKSWAIPKGPCLDPSVKRLAVEVEDHPIEYGNFEGTIPKGEYGGGTVILWDKGTWSSIDEDPLNAYHSGHLSIELNAYKLSGRWDLIRLKNTKNQWLLIKHKDAFAQSLASYDILVERPHSVLSNKTLE